MNTPTKPGWYWYRGDSSTQWQAVEVVDRSGLLYTWTVGSEIDLYIGRMGGEWGEPVAPNGLRLKLKDLVLWADNEASVSGPELDWKHFRHRLFLMAKQIQSDILNEWPGGDDEQTEETE